MNEKLTLQDIVALLAKKANITQKDADKFYRELFHVILDSIYRNEIVKIKDFGTFKLISISRRESVDVNTGGKIVIPAHYKMSFTPDRTLKNLVNKPFAHFESVVLEEGIDFNSSDENSKDIISEDISKSYDENIDENPDNTLNTEEKEGYVSDHHETTSENLEQEIVERSKEDFTGVVDSSGENDLDQINNPENQETEDLFVSDDIDNPVENLEPDDPERVEEDFSLAQHDDSLENDVIDEGENLEIFEENVIEDVESDLFFSEETENNPENFHDDTLLNTESQSISEDQDEIDVDIDFSLEDPENIDDDLFVVDANEDAVVTDESDLDTNLEFESDYVVSESFLDILKEDDKSIDEEDYSYTSSYTNYEQKSVATRLKQKLPLIIFISAVAIFVVYKVAELFEFTPEYEYYINRPKNLSLTDTLPYLNDINASFDIMDSVVIADNNISMDVVENQNVVETNENTEVPSIISDSVFNNISDEPANDNVIEGYKDEQEKEEVVPSINIPSIGEGKSIELAMFPKTGLIAKPDIQPITQNEQSDLLAEGESHDSSANPSIDSSIVEVQNVDNAIENINLAEKIEVETVQEKSVSEENIQIAPPSIGEGSSLDLAMLPSSTPLQTKPYIEKGVTVSLNDIAKVDSLLIQMSEQAKEINHQVKIAREHAAIAEENRQKAAQPKIDLKELAVKSGYDTSALKRSYKISEGLNFTIVNKAGLFVKNRSSHQEFGDIILE